MIELSYFTCVNPFGKTDDLELSTKGESSVNVKVKVTLFFFQNKRAMMALDRSPESFSPQINSTCLFLCFQLVIPSFDPKGHHTNKIDKGLQGDATYQIFKLYPFQFQRRRILKLVFFVPMLQLVTPGVGSVLTPKESYE